MTYLKLGKYDEACQTIQTLYEMPEWTSTQYERPVCVFLYAVTLKFLNQWKRATQIYAEMHEGRRENLGFKLCNQVCCLLLLPLEKQRTEIENHIENFIELVLLQNRDQFVDPLIAVNLGIIKSQPNPEH